MNVTSGGSDSGALPILDCREAEVLNEEVKAGSRNAGGVVEIGRDGINTALRALLALRLHLEAAILVDVQWLCGRSRDQTNVTSFRDVHAQNGTLPFPPIASSPNFASPSE